MNSALGTGERVVARRAGVMCTNSVSVRTTLLLCRFRFLLTTKFTKLKSEHSCLTEESALLSYVVDADKSSGDKIVVKWLSDESIGELLLAQPTANVEDRASYFMNLALKDLPSIIPDLEKFMADRASALLDAHRRVRTASKRTGLSYEVKPQGVPDILGVYVYLPR
jgi:hypothetical protein